MLLTKISFERPLFKEKLFFRFKNNAVEIFNRTQGCSIALEPQYKTEIIQLLRLLQIGGMTPQELERACPNIKENIPELLLNLERRDLLIETQSKVTSEMMSGDRFYHDLCRFVDRHQHKFPPSPFSQRMLDGTITKHQLIGYALESYHITHMCPRLLAPSMAKYESPATQRILQDFFVSELHHDRLIENSLDSVGIQLEQLQRMQPLPMTFALCSSLGVFAQQHPLSYKAALMLFEQDDPSFHELFQQQCDVLGLPPEFYKPILLHASINEEGEHGDIAKMLFAEIPYISPEEQLLVKRNMAILLESMVKRTHEMLDYYGNIDNPIPRCFDRTEIYS